jgi:hypothetical protein
MLALFFLYLSHVVIFPPVYAAIPKTDKKVAKESIERGTHRLVLNGKATHQVLFYKVYEVSLYLEKKSYHAQWILDSNQVKGVVLTFYRDVASKQLRDALKNGFRENCEYQCDHYGAALNQLLQKIPDFKAGDQVEFTFYPSKLEVQSSRGNVLEIKDIGFGKVLLSLWLGRSPPSEALKNKILGLELG